MVVNQDKDQCLALEYIEADTVIKREMGAVQAFLISNTIGSATSVVCTFLG